MTDHQDHLCHHRQEPTPGAECLEAVWSQGHSCKTCWVTCYRRGWSKAIVDHDNARLVAAHKTLTQKVPHVT